jgi:hypothetical protein
MGLSSSSSKTTPVFSKEITGAASNITGAYNAQAPKITGITDQLGAQAPGLIQRYNDGDPNVKAASGFNQDVLGGKYLGSNPFLEQNITNANNDIRGQAQAAAGVHGNWGDSSELQDITSRNIARNENDMRMQSYNTGLGLMGQQSALAPGIADARYQPLNQLTNIAQAQNMPLQAAVGAGSGVGGLLGQYANTKSNPAWGPAVLNAAAQAAGAYAACDVRLKTDIRRVGATHEGLPIYSFRYHGDSEPRMGPMAHEVEAMQPDNLGPTIGGYQTVKLGSIR